MYTYSNGPKGPNNPSSYIPPRYVPFDPHPWVASSQIMLWHLTEGGCDYVWVIKTYHRVYRDDAPPHNAICEHCAKKLKKMRKDADKGKKPRGI